MRLYTSPAACMEWLCPLWQCALSLCAAAERDQLHQQTGHMDWFFRVDALYGIDDRFPTMKRHFHRAPP
jgi:hypothetical protein